MPNAVTAPYRFARIHRHVHYPAWGHLVSHDVPFADGHNGEISICITAKTPLLVGKGRDASRTPGTALPFRAPDGKFAIPESSLQGMIRSVLEVACFAKLGPNVQDRRFAVRDIGPSANARAIYGSRITSGNGQDKANAIKPKAEAGWLIKDGWDVKLVPCQYGRISFADIARHRFPHNAAKQQNLENFLARTEGAGLTNEAKNADGRYNELLRPNGDLSLLQIQVGDPPPAATGGHGHNRELWIEARHCSLGGATQATLVLTGKPTTGNGQGRKHREFVFFGPDRDNVASPPKSPIMVPRHVWRDFLLIHEPAKGSGQDENPNWSFWKDEFKQGRPVPVFFLRDATGGVAAMGTAQMFKLAMPFSTHEMLAHSSPEHVRRYDGEPQRDSGKLDLPSLIFGCVGGKKDEWFRHKLKRRAAFDMAICSTAAEKPKGMDKIGPVPLLSPKPSYYPSYVRQPRGNGRRHVNGAVYAAYAPMGPDAARAQPELAGVKIWPAEGRLRMTGWAPADAPLTPDQQDIQNVLTWLDAVPAESSFTTTLRVHNLRKVELGALLWALTFGQNSAFEENGAALRHRLGGGKPFGLGEVEIRITGMALDRNDGEEVGDGPSIIEAFVDYMKGNEDIGPQWQETVQIQSLIKAATAQKYEGNDALTYIPTPLRHSELRNGWRVEQQRFPGGYFLPDYIEGEIKGKEFERPEVLHNASAAAAGQNQGAAAPQQRAAQQPAFPAEEGAPVRHKDGREGIIREVLYNACRVSVDGVLDVWPMGQFTVTGRAED